MSEKNKTQNSNQNERHTGFYEFRRSQKGNLQIRVSVEKYVLESRLKNNVTKDKNGREWVDLYCVETNRPTQYAEHNAHNAIAPLRQAQQTFVQSAQQNIPAPAIDTNVLMSQMEQAIKAKYGIK